MSSLKKLVVQLLAALLVEHVVLVTCIRVGDDGGPALEVVDESMLLKTGRCRNGIHLFSDMEGDLTFLKNWISGLVEKGAAKNPQEKNVTNPTWLQATASTGPAPAKAAARQVLKGLNYYHFELEPGHCVVNLGDMLDCGFQSEREQGVFQGLATFLMLKQKYKDRVIWLLGNRDVDKLTLPSFLDPSTGPYVYHVKPGPISNKENAGPDCATCKPSAEDLTGEGSLQTRWLKWTLAKTQGAGSAFKAYQEEMRKYSSSVTDDDVTDYVLHQTATDGGLFHDFLKFGGLAAQADGALFVHGGVKACLMADEEHFFAPNPDELKDWKLDLMMIAADRAKNPIDKYQGRAKQVEEYVVMLHTWKQRQFAAWSRNPYFVTEGCEEGQQVEVDESPPMFDEEEAIEAKAKGSRLNGAKALCRAGGALVDMSLSPPSPDKDKDPRNAGFTSCATVVIPTVKPVDESTASFLLKKGISHVFTGHIPQGAMPRAFVTKLGDDQFTALNMDVTYAHPVPKCQPGNVASQHCIRAVSVVVTYMPDKKDYEFHGVIAAAKAGSMLKVVSYKSGTLSEGEGFDPEQVKIFSGPGTAGGPPADQEPGTYPEEKAPFFSAYLTSESETPVGSGAVSNVALWKEGMFSAVGGAKKLWTSIDGSRGKQIRVYKESEGQMGEAPGAGPGEADGEAEG
eukprot:TRINITY_DN2739_c0_g1_i1.p1 TRINITY_DN2739_c0_g1~~TRINITY_DN2739_c0_g1_i1.p1  ORF type:complete len:681 (+),score=138.73 TRINITY_DN2739_c0_g1_i1:149-2191(+)